MSLQAGDGVQLEDITFKVRPLLRPSSDFDTSSKHFTNHNPTELERNLAALHQPTPQSHPSSLRRHRTLLQHHHRRLRHVARKRQLADLQVQERVRLRWLFESRFSVLILRGQHVDSDGSTKRVCGGVDEGGSADGVWDGK